MKHMMVLAPGSIRRHPHPHHMASDRIICQEAVPVQVGLPTVEVRHIHPQEPILVAVSGLELFLVDLWDTFLVVIQDTTLVTKDHTLDGGVEIPGGMGGGQDGGVVGDQVVDGGQGHTQLPQVTEVLASPQHQEVLEPEQPLALPVLLDDNKELYCVRLL